MYPLLETMKIRARGFVMRNLVLLYIGTCVLALLFQNYYPMFSERRLRSGRHFLRDRTDIFTFFIIVWTMLFSGLRLSYNDTIHYIGYFQNAATSLEEHFAISSELGFADNPLYYIVEVLVKSVINNYHVWFLLTAWVSCYVAVKFFRRYSTSFAMSLLLFYAIGTYVMYIAAIKQSIAVAILMCAIPLALKKKWIPYYLLVVLAIMFHTHAFLLLVLPLLMRKPWGKFTWCFAVATLFAMATYDKTLGAFMEYAQSIGANVAAVEVFDGHSVNVIRVIVYGIPPVLALIFRRRLFSNSTDSENLFMNMSILSWMILTIGTVEGGNLFARMAGYFEWATAIALPWMIKKLFEERSQKIVFACAAVLYTVYFLYEFSVSKNFNSEYSAMTLWQFIASLFS